MKSYQSLYCDESGVHKSDGFFFGALCGSPIRAKILRDEIRKFRVDYGCTREMKWTKVSPRMLVAYKAFVDIFFNDPFSYFRVLEVRRGPRWKDWATNEEERFFKAYYFLRGLMSPFCRYEVYLDHKPGKAYRWKSLHFAVNRAARKDYELKQKQIYSLAPGDSKQNDLLQLVDVLLGAVASEATAIAKTQLADYVKQRASEVTRYKKQKLESEVWSPYSDIEKAI